MGACVPDLLLHDSSSCTDGADELRATSPALSSEDARGEKDGDEDVELAGEVGLDVGGGRPCNTLAISSVFLLACAMASGVSPLSESALTSAPCAMRACTMVIFARRTARWSGVSPETVRALGSE